MSYLTDHWSVDWFLLLVLVAAAWYEVGLARMSAAERAEHRGRRSVLFYGGCAVLLLAVMSPVGYWADRYFFMHMIQHLLLMFAVPTLIVLSAPWRPLRAALPARLTSRTTANAGYGALGGIGRAALRPWVSVAIFNAVMVGWHVPAMLDLAERNQFAHGLMYCTFLVAGVLFWLQFIGSPPFPMKMPPFSQAAALLVTNVIMWVLAMAMGILTSSSWYTAYEHVPGVTLPAFADQQIGAGILWICGDFWAIPAMILVVRRLIAEDGSVASAIDRILGRGSQRYQWLDRS